MVPGAEKVRVRRTASNSASWPLMTFSQVGASESSKSAMKTLAPELSALMIILGSAGPVISTRRSLSTEGTGATFHSEARTAAVSARKSQLVFERR